MNKHFYYLDIVRSFAALCVLLVHSRYMCFVQFNDLSPEYKNTFFHAIYPFTSFGLYSVFAFFIMSGMLVGGRNLEKMRNGEINWRSFLINRLVRLYPPLLLVMLLIIGVNFFTGAPNNSFFIIGQFFGLQGICVPDMGGVFWTLAYEVWFYIMLLGIILFGTKKRIVGTIIFVLSLCVFLQLRAYCLFLLIIGVIVYEIKNYTFPKWIGLLAFFLSVFLTLFDSRFCIDSQIIDFLIGVFLSIVILNVSSAPKPESPNIILKLGEKMAPISYSLFLSHYQVLRIANYYRGYSDKFDIPSVLWWTGINIACILVAIIIYQLTEKHTKKLELYLNRIFLKNH